MVYCSSLLFFLRTWYPLGILLENYFTHTHIHIKKEKEKKEPLEMNDHGQGAYWKQT